MIEAADRIGTFLEDAYNQKRLLSAIDDVPLAGFEQSLEQQEPASLPVAAQERSSRQ